MSAPKNFTPPSTQAVCLGILFDTVTRTIAIPPENLQEINQICKCVKPARVFLNRMLQVLRDQAHKSLITLPPPFFQRFTMVQNLSATIQ